MRIAFVGATGFGLRCLEKVAALPGFQVVGVLTLPETFSISYRPQGVRNVLHADFRPFTARLGIPAEILRTPMTDPQVVQMFSSWRPELIVVVGWYHLVPKAVRAIAPAIGLHASLLPDYSGGAPLVWAIIHGEKRTGITLFELADGVDDGPVLAQAEEPIHEADTIATLYARIEERGLELLHLELPKIATGTAKRVAQDASRRRVFPQRTPEDGRIDWSWPARRVYDFVRAQTRPYPGAFALFNGQKVHVWRARVAGGRGGGFRVACGDGRALELEEVDYQGSTLSGTEFLARVGKEHADEARLLG